MTKRTICCLYAIVTSWARELVYPLFFFHSPSPGLPFELSCVLVNATYNNFSHLLFTPFVGGSLRRETIGSGPGGVWPSALLVAKATKVPEGGGEFIGTWLESGQERRDGGQFLSWNRTRYLGVSRLEDTEFCSRRCEQINPVSLLRTETS